MPTTPEPQDEDIWAGAGPWAWVTLPRGQVLRVIVTGRRRTPDGWWYECEALLWMRSQLPGGGWRPEQAPVRFDAPADQLETIPGQDYSAVPTIDERRPRPWAVVLYAREGDDGPVGILHRKDCHQGRRGLPLSDEEAVDTIRRADGRISPCDVCRPHTAPLWRRHRPRLER